MTTQKHSAQEWSDKVRDLLKQVQGDGHDVWISGYPEMGEGSLHIGWGYLNPAFDESEGK